MKPTRWTGESELDLARDVDLDRVGLGVHMIGSAQRQKEILASGAVRVFTGCGD